MLTALSTPVIIPAIFLSITFTTETAYIWSGLGNISWNGQTWIGLGSLLGVSVLEDGSSVEAKGISIKLSGLDSTLIGPALADYAVNLPVNLYMGIFSSGVLIPDPLVSWSGLTDIPTLDISGSTATLEIAAESRLLQLNTPCDRRYTLEDSQIDTPGELAFSFVSQIQQLTINWGQLPMHLPGGH
jgi:hypothetical protein